MMAALCGLMWSAIPSSAHPVGDLGVTSLDDHRRPAERVLMEVPDIAGYQTLLCDLHMHTVFSDGLVWPTIRVQEAWQEGLDAIAITDHIEYQPHREDIPTNHNRSYELASSAAREAGLILVKGSEITRMTPPGHFNAVFIEDASDFIEEREAGNFETDRAAISKAAEQGAFIFWNHPGWKVDDIEGSYEWSPFMEELLDADMIHGIEVINGFSFHRKALDWALDNGLAVMGTSDIHNLIAHDYDTQRGIHRSMTLVFASDRTSESLREALDAGRTVAWSNRYLAGDEKWLRALYEASVTIKEPHATDRRGNRISEITNTSDLIFELERLDPENESFPESITLGPRSSRMIDLPKEAGTTAAAYKVINAYTRSDQNLVVEIPGF
jgi:predicted metal-dependent phosphoesterase TrpH